MEIVQAVKNLNSISKFNLARAIEFSETADFVYNFA